MKNFSYQLYSSRNFPPLHETLQMLARLGYTQVEGYGALFNDDRDLGALRASLDASGLSMPTAHIGLEIIRDRPERAVEIANTLGVEAVFAPFLPEADRPDSPEGWVRFGTDLAEAGKPLEDAGINLGWHNHAFEFERIEDQLPIDLILSASDRLSVEFDVAWCVKAGEDPLHWINSNADRISAAHIKDIAPAGQAIDEDGWADVGHGVLDWPAIMSALAATSSQWAIAEHDNPTDHLRFATRSLAAMRGF